MKTFRGDRGCARAGSDDARCVSAASSTSTLARRRARNASVDAVAVSYGAHPHDTLHGHGPLCCAGSVEELRQWLTTNA